MLTVNDLSFSYGSQKLFSGLELSLAAGGICGLLGKNGAGKTTLLKLLAGLLFPQQGVVQALGHCPAGRSRDFLCELFLVPEEFRLPAVTSMQYQRLFAPFYPRFDVDRYQTLLDEFGLDAQRNLTRCSFGQRKKCLLAFCLAAGCRLAFLDEPTNGLDIPSKSQFRRALASVATEDRLFIIATHQVRDLESLIDPVVILDEGRVIFNQTMEAVSRCLRVNLQDTPPVDDEALFYEKTLEGFRVVQENTGNDEAHMDLELLFNTVVQNRENVAAVFKRRSTHES